ncbi:hypothetical protein DL96DRAFT_1473492 [Flagelloscypha sp. PMI_526]|nr:hypothetical protein DL96DRAFT_1473492 [Flagelloscypha sp. PMI_526]
MQVDSARPNKVFRQDFAAYRSSVGTIYPETRKVQVTHSISTVAQFRSIDYGMEQCEIHIRFPSVVSESRPARLSLYRLDSSRILNPNTLTYKNIPLSFSKLAEIDQNMGEYKRNVTCVTDSLLTFELKCSNDSRDECNLEWLQNPKQRGEASELSLPLICRFTADGPQNSGSFSMQPNNIGSS